MASDYFDRAVPTCFRAACEICGNMLDTRKEGTHQWTSGWVMQRAGGGGHGISLPERSNRWAHRDCVERKTRGYIGQSNLFGSQK